jgi:hypothetical protein
MEGKYSLSRLDISWNEYFGLHSVDFLRTADIRSMVLQPFGPWPLFSFLILYTFGRTAWKGDQPVARPLRMHRTTQTQSKCTQTSMHGVGFEHTTRVFERGKTVHALDRAFNIRRTPHTQRHILHIISNALSRHGSVSCDTAMKLLHINIMSMAVLLRHRKYEDFALCYSVLATFLFVIISWHVCWKPEFWNQQKKLLRGTALQAHPLLHNGSVAVTWSKQ